MTASQRVPVRLQQGAFDDVDVCILQKTTFDFETTIRDLRQVGVRVIVDVCDNIEGLPHLAHYPAMVRMADLATVSSSGLLDIVHRAGAAQAELIPDCIENTQCEPTYGTVPDVLRLVWFGRSDNIDPLLDSLSDLEELATGRSVALEIVTDSDSDLTNRLNAAARHAARHLDLTVTPWSPAATEGALARASLALMPAGSQERFTAKSPNRLAAALWAGCVPIAAPQESYQDFETSALLATDVIDGIAYALTNWAGLNDRVRIGQTVITHKYTPQAVARRWSKVLGELVARPNNPIPLPVTGRPAKLHLGCDGNILPGFINIDRAKSTGGVQPDLITEPGNLAMIADESISMLLAVDVLNANRMSVVLHDWQRVLISGAELVIEAPNADLGDEVVTEVGGFALDAESSAEHLAAAGFSDIRRETPTLRPEPNKRLRLVCLKK